MFFYRIAPLKCQMSSVQGDFSKQFLNKSVLPRGNSVSLTKKSKADEMYSVIDYHTRSVSNKIQVCASIFSYRDDMK